MNKKKYSIYTVGTPTIVMVLVILCLVTFATLSMVSSKSDYQLSKTLSERTTDYYKASSDAQKRIASINEVLKSIWNENTADSYLEAIIQSTEIAELGTATVENGTVNIDFDVVVSDSQSLEVSLGVIQQDNTTGMCYKLLEYKTVNTAEWEAEDSLNVYIP